MKEIENSVDKVLDLSAEATQAAIEEYTKLYFANGIIGTVLGLALIPLAIYLFKNRKDKDGELDPPFIIFGALSLVLSIVLISRSQESLWCPKAKAVKGFIQDITHNGR